MPCAHCDSSFASAEVHEHVWFRSIVKNYRFVHIVTKAAARLCLWVGLSHRVNRLAHAPDLRTHKGQSAAGAGVESGHGAGAGAGVESGQEQGLELRLELELEACRAGRQDTMSCDSRHSTAATPLPSFSRLKQKAAAFDRSIRRKVFLWFVLLCWHPHHVARAPLDREVERGVCQQQRQQVQQKVSPENHQPTCLAGTTSHLMVCSSSSVVIHMSNVTRSQALLSCASVFCQ